MSNELIVQKGSEVQVSASTPDEMMMANAALVTWCDTKIAGLQAEEDELTASYEVAKKNKWKSTTLKKHADLAGKRMVFYAKMKQALEEGFMIVPNFPVEVFAIRSTKEKPLKLLSTNHWDRHQQNAATLNPGEGEYRNPFPAVMQRSFPPDDKGNVSKEFWAEQWKEMEFPLTMCKPHIMEATNRAMALRLFDDFGILPSTKRTDPLIVARLKDPRSTQFSQKFITFIVAWYLDTEMI